MIQFTKIIYEMLELKTLELKLSVLEIDIYDVADYFFKIIIKDKKINNISDVAYYVYNIKINKIIEYINNKHITDKNLKLGDFEDMFK